MPMKMIERAAIVGGVIAGATLAAPQASAAVKIDASNFGACVTPASSVCTAIPGATLTAASDAGTPEFALQVFSVDSPDITGLGVTSDVGSGSPSDPEIQIRSGDQESITIDFDNPLPIAEIHIAHFYNSETVFPPAMGPSGNEPDERLQIVGTPFGGGPDLVFQLLNTPSGFVVEDGSATAAFVGGDQDLISITNLFAGTAIETLFFTALDGENGGANDNSDFSIASVAQVPLPAAAWFMIGGLGAVAGIARRNRRAQTA